MAEQFSRLESSVIIEVQLLQHPSARRKDGAEKEAFPDNGAVIACACAWVQVLGSWTTTRRPTDACAAEPPGAE